jgi:hypothetical protein
LNTKIPFRDELTFGCISSHLTCNSKCPCFVIYGNYTTTFEKSKYFSVHQFIAYKFSKQNILFHHKKQHKFELEKC